MYSNLKADIADLQETLDRVGKIVTEGSKAMPDPRDEWGQEFADLWIEWAGGVLNAYSDDSNTEENIINSVAALMATIIHRLIETEKVHIKAELWSGGTKTADFQFFCSDAEFSVLSLSYDLESAADTLSKLIDEARDLKEDIQCTIKIGTKYDITGHR